MDARQWGSLYCRGDSWFIWVGRMYAYDVFCVLSYLHSSVFNDFGPKFTVVDPTGEEPLTAMIVSIEKVRNTLS